MVQDTTRKFTRQELYDLVWARPMSQLAKEFDISDVGLRKICRQHNIPTASNRWWAAKTFGKPGQRDPLPNRAGQAGAVITLHIRNPDREQSRERQEAKARIEKVMKVASKEQGEPWRSAVDHQTVFGEVRENPFSPRWRSSVELYRHRHHRTDYPDRERSG